VGSRNRSISLAALSGAPLNEVAISCLVNISNRQQPRFTASSWRASSSSSQWQKWIRPVRSLRSMTRMAPWSWSMKPSDADSASDLATRRICRSIPMCKDFIGSVTTNHKCLCHPRWVLCLCAFDCACGDEKDIKRPCRSERRKRQQTEQPRRLKLVADSKSKRSECLFVSFRLQPCGSMGLDMLRWEAGWSNHAAM